MNFYGAILVKSLIPFRRKARLFPFEAVESLPNDRSEKTPDTRVVILQIARSSTMINGKRISKSYRARCEFPVFRPPGGSGASESEGDRWMESAEQRTNETTRTTTGRRSSVVDSHPLVVGRSEVGGIFGDISSQSDIQISWRLVAFCLFSVPSFRPSSLHFSWQQRFKQFRQNPRFFRGGGGGVYTEGFSSNEKKVFAQCASWKEIICLRTARVQTDSYQFVRLKYYSHSPSAAV